MYVIMLLYYILTQIHLITRGHMPTALTQLRIKYI